MISQTGWMTHPFHPIAAPSLPRHCAITGAADSVCSRLYLSTAAAAVAAATAATRTGVRRHDHETLQQPSVQKRID